MKHLLFIHYNANSTGSFVEKILAQISYFQPKYKITVILPAPGSFSERLNKHQIRVIYRPLTENNGLFSYIRAFFSFLGLLRRERVDLIYLLDFVWWKPAEVLAAKFAKIPTVAFIGFYKDDSAKHGGLAKVDWIVANSQATAAKFLEFGWEHKTRVIHNFVDLNLYRPMPSIRSSFGAEDRPLVGYVGALHPIKGIEYLLEALAGLITPYPNLKAVIVGKEKVDGYLASLEELAEKYKLREVVSFLGFRRDIPDVMRALDILVVPSVDEPFGYINIEAGAAGIPVVASDVGGIKEIVVNHQTGILVPAGDSKAIAEACWKLLDDKELRKELGKRGAERVRDYFSTTAILPQWGKLFSEALGE